MVNHPVKKQCKNWHNPLSNLNKMKCTCDGTLNGSVWVHCYVFFKNHAATHSLIRTHARHTHESIMFGISIQILQKEKRNRLCGGEKLIKSQSCNSVLKKMLTTFSQVTVRLFLKPISLLLLLFLDLKLSAFSFILILLRSRIRYIFIRRGICFGARARSWRQLNKLSMVFQPIGLYI